MIDLSVIRNNIKHKCQLPPEKTAELCDEIDRLSAENSELRLTLKGVAMSGDVPADLRKHIDIILERVSTRHADE